MRQCFHWQQQIVALASTAATNAGAIFLIRPILLIAGAGIVIVIVAVSMPGGKEAEERRDVVDAQIRRHALR